MQYRVIYLAGFISVDYPESLIWRERVTPILEDIGFEVRTPMAGKKNLKMHTTDGGMNMTINTPKSIIMRDRRDVRESDIILAHLENFGSPRPLLGTISELAWAYDEHKPVIGIAVKNNVLMRQHPFMVEFISRFEESEADAIEHLKLYWHPLAHHADTDRR